MGWKLSMIVINSEDSKNEKNLLQNLGFENYTEVESQLLDSILVPDDGMIYIGNYNGNTIVCHQDVPIEFLNPEVSEWENRLSSMFPNTEIASLILQSTVNLWGYSITKNNNKIRIHAGCAEGDFSIDDGEILDEEKKLFSQSQVDQNGNRTFIIDDNEYHIDQVGENFVFDISKRFFGESLDSSDGLLFETTFKGYQLGNNKRSKTSPLSLENEGHQIYASRNVLNGDQVNLLHKEIEVWVAVSRNEFDQNKKIEDQDFEPITEDYLFQRIPKLKDNLDQPNKTTINIDYNTGEININKQHRHLGIPTHSAKATRQADAGFSFIYYLRITKARLYKPLAICLILLICALTIGWLFYIPLVLYGGFQILATFKTRDMYYSGALGPAIVIDAENHKIAALTDLTLGHGEYPVIRIRNYPLPEKYRKNGQKIPVAGSYQNTEDYNHWNFYEPNPLPSGIKNDALINDKIVQIPTHEWVELTQEIKKFQGIPKEGFYPIRIDTSDWKDIDISKIEWMQFGEEK